jgi:hypothetical protein
MRFTHIAVFQGLGLYNQPKNQRKWCDGERNASWLEVYRLLLFKNLKPWWPEGLQFNRQTFDPILSGIIEDYRKISFC